MGWLSPFAAMVMAAGVVSALLPSGSIKKTALMVMGLMLMLCWLQCLPGLFRLNAAEAPLSPLTHTALAPGNLSPDASDEGR